MPQGNAAQRSIRHGRAGGPPITPAETTARALALHRQGDLSAAEPLYRAVLARHPRHFEALHLLGLLHAMRQDPAAALPLLRRAIAVDDRHGFVHSNLGNALVELGQAAEGLDAFNRAVALDPGLAEARVGRGNALQALGRNAEALTALDEARALGADMAELHNNRGNALRALGRPREALDAYDAAITRNPVYAGAHANRATALSDLDRDAEALVSVGIALALRPDDPGFLNMQGVVLRSLRRSEEALASFDRALALAPAFADAYANRVAALCDLNRQEEALASAETSLALSRSSVAHRNRAAALAQLRRHEESEAEDRAALEADPGLGEAWNGRGNALTELGRFEEAIGCFARAAGIFPASPSIPFNRGNALRGLGRHREAVAAFDESIALQPEYAEAHWNRSLSLLALGELEEGFRGYEWRWRRKLAPPRRHAEAPLWLGEPAEGRTLLLHAEQGLGDTIQMARFIPLVAARGARVVVEAPRTLHPLLRRLPGISALTGPDEPPPPHDLQCPLMSLPLAFNTRLHTIPTPIPYLSADLARAGAWDRDLPSGALRLGIACSGNPDHPRDHERSIPLSLFAPLLRPGVEAFVVQTQIRASDEAFLASASGLTDLRPRLTGFDETAAALLAMDAVVCVDTSVAHLAGALGTPAHLLLPTLPDWRWLVDRADSPWYPGMRLHRRALGEGWESVIERVAASLARSARLAA